MRFSMLYSGEQILSFKSCLVFYAGDSLSMANIRIKKIDLNVREYSEHLNSVSSQCAHDKSSIARKLEDHPRNFKW